MTNSNLLLTWPPDFTLVKSQRAQSVRLKTSIRKGLEVVIPYGFKQENIPDILEKHKSWIQKKLAEFAIASEPLKRPETITLLALNKTWQIVYMKTRGKRIRLIPRPQQELVLMGNIDDINACCKLVSLWVKEEAKSHLATVLKKLSEQTRLTYKSLSIRGQHTRWGSCSSDRSLNLNYKLMFLKSELVEHVILHELCHTKHMNHSNKFWRLLASFDANWKENAKQVRGAVKMLPEWVVRL